MTDRTQFPLKSFLYVMPLLFIYIGAVVYIQFFLNPTFYTDQRIYQDAASKATQGQSPYFPFQIPLTFVYPPAILPVFALFNLISFDLARVIWITISIFLYLTALGIIWNWLKPEPTLRNIGIFSLMLFYGPLSENLTIGQVDCVILLGLTLLVASQAQTEETGKLTGQKQTGWLGGLGLAIAALIKFTPAMLGLIILWHRNWLRLGQTIWSTIMLSSVSILIFGLGVWLDFGKLIPSLIVTGSSDHNNQRITTTLAWLLKTTEDDKGVRLLGSLFSLIVVGSWLILLIFRSRRERPVAITLLGIVVLTISSSLVWYHHFLFLVLPLLYILVKYEKSPLVWAGWFGLGAIQLDRPVEVVLKWPPVLSLMGYLAVYTVMVLVVWQTYFSYQPERVTTSPVSLFSKLKYRLHRKSRLKV